MKKTRLLAFSHIPKTAGTTMNMILERHFGYHHVGVEYRVPPPIYTARDLAVDLKLHPGARSLSGHTLKPFVHYEENEERLTWYTILREPIERFMSHYQHQYTSGSAKFRLPLSDWMRTYQRDNWMVRMIAGDDDTAAAKQILAEKFKFVGFTERFDESLILFRHFMDLSNLDVDYPAPSNTSPKNGMRRRIRADLEEIRDEVVERNDGDLELYRFALQKIWPEQVAEFGCERLACEVRDVFRRSQLDFTDRYRIASFNAYRTIVYKPSLWLDRKFSESVR